MDNTRNINRYYVWLLTTVVFLLAGLAQSSVASAFSLERANLNSGGGEANDTSETADVSADGRFITYVSSANNLVAHDTNNRKDVFVFDRQTRTTELVSTGTSQPNDSSFGNDDSFSPTITTDGRYVAFVSAASNLVPGDGNGRWDIFLYDRITHVTKKITEDFSGSDTDNSSLAPRISDDGRWIAYDSAASDIVAGDTNGYRDVFVYDTVTNATKLISHDNAGKPTNGDSAGATVSTYDPANGLFDFVVAYESNASNLSTTDTNGVADIFVYSSASNTTMRVGDSANPNGASTLASISGDGRTVAFQSEATNLTPDVDTNGKSDVFVATKGGKLGTLERVSSTPDGNQFDDGSMSPSLSANGKMIVFTTAATNIPGGNPLTTDVLAVDRDTGEQRVLSSPDSGPGNNHSSEAVVSANGDSAVFSSLADNLVGGDTNGKQDIFFAKKSKDDAKPEDPVAQTTDSAVAVDSASSDSAQESSASTESSSSSVQSSTSAVVATRVPFKGWFGYTKRWWQSPSKKVAKAGSRKVGKLIYMKITPTEKATLKTLKVKLNGRTIASASNVKLTSTKRKVIALKATSYGRKLLNSKKFGKKRKTKVSVKSVAASDGATYEGTRNVTIRRVTQTK